MRTFDFDKYKGQKVVVWCKTEEEAKEFCKMMHDAGLKWCSGDSYLQFTNWFVHEEDTCYNPNNGMFSDKIFFKTEGYDIIPFDILKMKIEQEETQEQKTLSESDLQAIINYYGENQQHMQAMEEAGELIQAISKVQRADGTDKYKSARHNLISEIADIYVMCKQLMLMHSITEEAVISTANKKIKRQLKRMWGNE